MQWRLTQEQDDYRDALACWLADIAPADVRRGWLDAGDRASFVKAFSSAGWAGVGIAEELGGQGGGMVELALTAECLAAAAVPSDAWLATALAAPALVGDPELAARVVADPAVAQATARAAVLVAADTLGASQAMLDLAVEYSRQRRQFGVPIGSFQAVKHAAATMLVGIEAARSVVYYAPASVESGHEQSMLHAAAAKAQVTAEGVRAADSALTRHGAIGYTWEHDLQLFYKRAKLNQSLFGPPSAWNERIAAGLELGQFHCAPMRARPRRLNVCP